MHFHCFYIYIILEFQTPEADRVKGFKCDIFCYLQTLTSHLHLN